MLLIPIIEYYEIFNRLWFQNMNSQIGISIDNTSSYLVKSYWHSHHHHNGLQQNHRHHHDGVGEKGIGSLPNDHNFCRPAWVMGSLWGDLKLFLSYSKSSSSSSIPLMINELYIIFVFTQKKGQKWWKWCWLERWQTSGAENIRSFLPHSHWKVSTVKFSTVKFPPEKFPL